MGLCPHLLGWLRPALGASELGGLGGWDVGPPNVLKLSEVDEVGVSKIGSSVSTPSLHEICSALSFTYTYDT